jgi:hypothetical protein
MGVKKDYHLKRGIAMASSQAQPMPQTIEAYKALAQRDLELIEAQRDEIGRLKAELNLRKQQIVSLKIRTQKLVRMAGSGEFTQQ